MEQLKNNAIKGVNQFTYNFIQKEWSKIALYLFSMLASAIIPLYLSIQISQLMNNILVDGSVNESLIIPFIMVFLYGLFIYLNHYYSINLVASYQTKLINLKFNTLIHGYKNILNNNKNDSSFSQKIINESQYMANFYIQSVVQGIRAILMLLVVFILLFNENETLTLILGVVLIGAVIILFLLNRQVYVRQKKVIELSSKYFGISDSWLNNIEQIKLFDLFHKVYQEILNYGLKLITAILHSFDIELIEMAILSSLRYFFVAIFILYSASVSMATIGNVFLIVALLTQFFNYVDELKQGIIACQKSIVSKDVLDSIECLKENLSSFNKEKIIGVTNVEVSHVLSKKQKCQPIDVNFIPNTVYCITGENGIGKSTFFNILLGLEEEYIGTITINGKSIRAIDLQDMYGKSIIYMDQNSELLEYIDVENERIELSRGERQNYLLTHLFTPLLQDCLILLDEPTASLDVQTKQKLVKIIDRIKENNIIILISHDPFILDQPYSKVRLK